MQPASKALTSMQSEGNKIPGVTLRFYNAVEDIFKNLSESGISVEEHIEAMRKENSEIESRIEELEGSLRETRDQYKENESKLQENVSEKKKLETEITELQQEKRKLEHNLSLARDDREKQKRLQRSAESQLEGEETRRKQMRETIDSYLFHTFLQLVHDIPDKRQQQGLESLLKVLYKENRVLSGLNELVNNTIDASLKAKMQSASSWKEGQDYPKPPSVQELANRCLPPYRRVPVDDSKRPGGHARVVPDRPHNNRPSGNNYNDRSSSSMGNKPLSSHHGRHGDRRNDRSHFDRNNGDNRNNRDRDHRDHHDRMHPGERDGERRGRDYDNDRHHDRDHDRRRDRDRPSNDNYGPSNARFAPYSSTSHSSGGGKGGKSFSRPSYDSSGKGGSGSGSGSGKGILGSRGNTRRDDSLTRSYQGGRLTFNRR